MSEVLIGCYICGKELVIDPYAYKNDVMPLEVCRECASTKPEITGLQMEGNNYLMFDANDLENYWTCNTSLH
jgi:hypothetical protein